MRIRFSPFVVVGLLALTLMPIGYGGIWTDPSLIYDASDFHIHVKAVMEFTDIKFGSDYVNMTNTTDESGNCTFASNMTTGHTLVEKDGHCGIGNYTTQLSFDVYAPSDWTVNNVYSRVYANHTYLAENKTTGFTITTLNSTHKRYTYTHNPSDSLTDAQLGWTDVNVFVNAENASLIYYGNRTWNNLFQVYNLQEPFSYTSSYNTTLNSVNMTWQATNNTDKYVVLRSNTSCPACGFDSYEVQNDTNTSYNASSVLDQRFYAVESYNATTMSYSAPFCIPWGVLNITVRNESAPWQVITPFNILISNYSGTQTYYNGSCVNYLKLDLLQIPYGVNTIITINATGYYGRVWYVDLIPNNFYNYTYYLPPVLTGSGTGYGGENGTSQLYRFKVVETIATSYGSYDSPIENADVLFKKYINTTDSYETMSSLLTSADGFCNIYLIPTGLYQIVTSKSGFDTTYTYYTAEIPDLYGHVNDYTIRLVRTQITTNFTVWHTVFDYEYGWADNTTVYLYMNDHTYDSAGGMQYVIVGLYDYNGTLLDEVTYTAPPPYFNYTHASLNPKQIYRFSVYISYDKDEDVWTDNVSFTILPYYPDPSLPLEDILTHTLGPSPFYVTDPFAVSASWCSGIFLLIIGFILFTFDRAYAGLGLVAAAIVSYYLTYTGLVIIAIPVCGLLAFLGILLIMRERKES